MEDPALTPSSNDADPNSQIQPNVEGDGNQIIDKVTGGNVFANVTGNVNIPTIVNYYYREEVKIPIDDATESAEEDPLPCPYRSLFHFGPGDAKYFFGRESFVEELVKATQTRNFIPLLGASGSGKSSVVLAGLVPKLQQAGDWQFTHFRPGPDPFYALAEALVPLYMSEIDSTDKITQAGKLAESLKEGTPLSHIFSSIQRQHPNDRVLLIADQFEELYTLCTDEATRRNFLDKLLAGIAAPADHIPFAPLLVATMRADFLGNALSYRPFADVLQNADLKLGPMNRTELADAIAKPAKKVGHPLDLSTINLLIEQTEGREGALPLLQFALTRIWTGLTEDKEPAETLRAIGGVGGALAGEAQRIYESLPSEEQEITRRIFLGLVQLGEGSKDTRRRTDLERIVSHRDSLEQVKKVIGRFSDPSARLITLAEDGGTKTVEVTYEALFNHWQQMKDWLDGSRSDLRFQRRLDEAAMVWQGHGQPKGNLWRSPDLDLLRSYYERSRDDMTPLQLEFFNVSINEEKAQKQADEKAEKERKKQRQLLNIGILLTCGVAIFSANIIYLYQKTNQLNKNLQQEKDRLYEQYAYCPKEKGRPGEKVEKDICFRSLVTSGNVNVFLSSTNFHLTKGVEAFKQKDYQKAKILFNQAVEADRSDPVPKIFLNNTNAELQGKPLKLAVVSSIDYYETAAREVLRGVADAQQNFNEKQGNKARLMEIVIANDENEPTAATKVAQELVSDPNIFGIIGHHSSESTKAAQPIYMKEKIALISPTSSSSKLEGYQFFRTIGNTKKSAKKYADYIIKNMKLDKMFVFYMKNSEYSENLMKDFGNSFSNEGGQKLDKNNTVDVGSSSFNIDKTIQKISNIRVIKAALLISNVKSNSIAIAINRKNASLSPKHKLQLLGAMSLSEEETLQRGGEAVEGMILVRPCLLPQYEYMKNAAKRWLQNEISWRTATSYDAAQAFSKAISLSKKVSRENILEQLQSPSFLLKTEETSGFGLKWDPLDHSNADRKYCVVQIKDGKFIEK